MNCQLHDRFLLGQKRLGGLYSGSGPYGEYENLFLAFEGNLSPVARPVDSYDTGSAIPALSHCGGEQYLCPYWKLDPESPIFQTEIPFCNVQR
jgi:hypothetical protein